MGWVSSSSNIQTKNPATSDVFPFMDHWNAQTQKVSLRQIISEEIAMQEKQDLVWIAPFLMQFKFVTVNEPEYVLSGDSSLCC